MPGKADDGPQALGLATKGFTLVELLVVVGIIIVLAGLAFPAFTSAKNRAIQTSCLSNLRQIGIAIGLYAGDHDDLVPPYTNKESYLAFFEPGMGPGVPTASVQPMLLFSSLDPYARSQDIWFCPQDVEKGTPAFRFGIRHKVSSFWFRFTTVDRYGEWPLRFNLSTDQALGGILVQDALELGRKHGRAWDITAHSDDSVNQLYQDLSVHRVADSP